ncbi:MAG: hypothetical protein JWQ59_2399 [Cryobacterium sp.]|nr:hypothetical protein [Cryobacterium sp.]
MGVARVVGMPAAVDVVLVVQRIGERVDPPVGPRVLAHPVPLEELADSVDVVSTEPLGCILDGVLQRVLEIVDRPPSQVRGREHLAQARAGLAGIGQRVHRIEILSEKHVVAPHKSVQRLTKLVEVIGKQSECRDDRTLVRVEARELVELAEWVARSVHWQAALGNGRPVRIIGPGRHQEGVDGQRRLLDQLTQSVDLWREGLLLLGAV